MEGELVVNISKAFGSSDSALQGPTYNLSSSGMTASVLSSAILMAQLNKYHVDEVTLETSKSIPVGTTFPRSSHPNRYVFKSFHINPVFAVVMNNGGSTAIAVDRYTEYKAIGNVFHTYNGDIRLTAGNSVPIWHMGIHDNVFEICICNTWGNVDDGTNKNAFVNVSWPKNAYNYTSARMYVWHE